MPARGVPLALAIAVALVRSLRRPLAVGRTREAFDLDVHHARGDEGHHLPEEIVIGALLKQLLHCHSVDGHGIRLSVCSSWQTEPTESDHDRPAPGAGAVDGSSYGGSTRPQPLPSSYTTTGDTNADRAASHLTPPCSTRRRSPASPGTR